MSGRNVEMAARIEAMPAADTVRFAVAGDSSAWPDPTAEAIFAQLVRQVAELDPAPAFFVNLGDFAGPGTPERHERYLELVAPLAIPSLCVVGNHELDHPAGPETFERIHGPASFTFAHGHTRFVALDAAPGSPGEIEVVDGEGPGEATLAFLDASLGDAPEPNRVVLMHMPPSLDGHYAPHADWGFRAHEQEFLDLLRERRVGLVCAAHGLAFDTLERGGTRFVMSGGGGTGLCSHLHGICTQGDGRPEDRGALFHAVELAVTEAGEVSGRVLQAFAPPGEFRFAFG
jgi:hypothetical protein